MQQKKPNNKSPQNQSSRHYEYQVCDVQSAGCINKYGMYVSEPWKYAGTHILLHCGMALHYYATFPYLHVALGIINIILHLSCTLVLIKLAFTDPGMIPKILPSYQKLAFRKIPTNYQRYATLLKYYQKNFRTVIKGHNLQLKFCNTCYIYRPPRTVHCQDCGICVQKFDHHCPWIGTCVAKRNYKYFLSFLTVLSLLTVKIFIQSIVVSAETARWDEAQIIAKSVINIFLCIYIFPAMGFAVFMLVLHLKFAATNVTTNQFCKQTWQTLQGNPFKKHSWFKNMFKVISLHYQGKVKLQERVYDRNDRILMENDSLSSLNDTRQINCTIDNLNNVNQFKSQTHKNYSTNDRIQREHQMQNFHSQKEQQSKEITNNHRLKEQKRETSFQNGEEVGQSFDQPISIYDIGIKVQSGGKDQYKKLDSKGNQQSQSSSSNSSQRPSTSALSQKDNQQYGTDEIARQQEQKLKVIIEENEADHQNQDSSYPKNNQSTFDQPRSPNKMARQESIIKMDSQDSSVRGSRIIGFSGQKNSENRPNLNQNQKINKREQNINQPLSLQANDQNQSNSIRAQKLKNSSI